MKSFVALFVLLGGTIHSLSWKFHRVVYGALSETYWRIYANKRVLKHLTGLHG